MVVITTILAYTLLGIWTLASLGAIAGWAWLTLADSVRGVGRYLPGLASQAADGATEAEHAPPPAGAPSGPRTRGLGRAAPGAWTGRCTGAAC